MNIFGRLFKKNAGASRITNFNIYWKGRMHALPGMELKGGRFTYELPFRNSTTEDELTFLKSQKRPPEVIEKVEVSGPFTLVSVEPQPPISVEQGTSVTLKMVIDPPAYSYSGPAVIKLGAHAEEQVRIELPAVLMKSGSKSVNVLEHGEIKVIGKGAEFEESVQMYRVLGYGAQVKSVTVNKPFEFVKTEPALPFTIDDKSSFVVAFFIKAPAFDYAGPLEITVA